MIGQTLLLSYIERVKDDFPNFVVIIGPHGSGKRTLAKHIAGLIHAQYSACGIKVDDIRAVIDTAMRVTERVLYCIEDADTMSNEAKNAMLKITEEPPRNAYFIMTVSNEGSVLDTIKSRALVLHIQPYSYTEIEEYYDSVPEFNLSGIDKETVCEIATNLQEVNMLCSYGKEFIDFVNLVVDNISEVESANAFKSSGRLALKNEPDKYDLKVFWDTFCCVCLYRIREDPLRYSHGILVTSPFISTVSTRTGVNLGQLYDTWVFKIREVWI